MLSLLKSDVLRHSAVYGLDMFKSSIDVLRTKLYTTSEDQPKAESVVQGDSEPPSGELASLKDFDGYFHDAFSHSRPTTPTSSNESAHSTGSYSPTSSTTSISVEACQEAIALAVERTKEECVEAHQHIESDYKSQIYNLKKDLKIEHRRHHTSKIDIIRLSKKDRDHKREYKRLYENHEALISKHNSTEQEVETQTKLIDRLESQAAMRECELGYLRDLFLDRMNKGLEYHHHMVRQSECLRILGTKYWQLLVLMRDFHDENYVPEFARVQMATEAMNVFGCYEDGQVDIDWKNPSLGYVDSFLERYPMESLFTNNDTGEPVVEVFEDDGGENEIYEMNVAIDEDEAEADKENTYCEGDNVAFDIQEQNVLNAQGDDSQVCDVREGTESKAGEASALTAGNGPVEEAVEGAEENGAPSHKKKQKVQQKKKQKKRAKKNSIEFPIKGKKSKAQKKGQK